MLNVQKAMNIPWYFLYIYIVIFFSLKYLEYHGNTIVHEYMNNAVHKQPMNNVHVTFSCNTLS